MEERHRLLGQLVVNFANAETTDNACLRLFDSMLDILGFKPDFAEQIKKRFPAITNMSPPFRTEAAEYKDLISQEAEIIGRLSRRFTFPGSLFDLKGVDRYEETLTFLQLDYMSFGPDDYDINVVDEKQVKIDNVKELIKIYKDKSVKDEIAQLDSIWTRFKIIEVHKDIRKMQENLRCLLDSIQQNANFCEIPHLLDYLERYNALQKSKLLLVDANIFVRTPPINEGDYMINRPVEWLKRIQDDLAYCLIEFLIPEENRRYINKCRKCQKFYVSKTIRPSKFCSDKCRLAWHNRKRIVSGKAAEYKRRKRKEGAKESYYG